MRSFSEEEKVYISAIVGAYKSDWENMILKNLVFSIFERSIDLNQPGFELKENESDDEKSKKEYGNVIKNGYIPISNFFSTLIYLQSNQLIVIVPYFESEDFDLEFVGKNVVEGNRKWFGISTSSYLEFLKSNYSNFIYPTQELIDLVNNKFKSREEKRHYQVIFWTRAALAVALFSSLITTYDILTSKDDATIQELKRINKTINRQKSNRVIMINDSINIQLHKILNTKKASTPIPVK